MWQGINALVHRYDTDLSIKGFIIDNVQFSMNLLLVNLLLMLLGLGYFIVFVFLDGVQIEYLFFAVGFQIISSQGALILILTFISKIWTKEHIARQLGLLIQCQYFAKVFAFCILLPIFLFMNEEELIHNQLYLAIMGVLAVLLVVQIIAASKLFGDLKQLGINRFANLKVISPDEQQSLLDTLKLTLSTTASVVAIAGSLVNSASRAWLDQQFQFINLYFGLKGDDNDFITQFSGMLSYIVGIIVLRIMVKSQIFIHRKLWLFSMACSLQFINFFMLAILSLCSEADFFMRTLFYTIATFNLQVSQAISFLTVYSLIGQREDLIYILGFVYGLLSTFLNLFQLWILTVWFSTIDANPLYVKSIAQLKIYLAFALVFTIIGLVLTQVLIFAQQQLHPKGKQLKINKKQSYDSQHIVTSGGEAVNLQQQQRETFPSGEWD